MQLLCDVKAMLEPRGFRAGVHMQLQLFLSQNAGLPSPPCPTWAPLMRSWLRRSSRQAGEQPLRQQQAQQALGPMRLPMASSPAALLRRVPRGMPPPELR